MTAAKVHYWDASALVKLVAVDTAERRGQAELRSFFFNNANQYVTSASLAETLGVFKRKWLVDEVYSQTQYVLVVREYYRLVVSHVAVDEVAVSAQVLDEAERLMTTYKLDFVDAIQVVTVLTGRYSVLLGESKSWFITADRRLARAARKEGARVWRCTSQQPPPEGRAA